MQNLIHCNNKSKIDLYEPVVINIAPVSAPPHGVAATSISPPGNGSLPISPSAPPERGGGG